MSTLSKLACSLGRRDEIPNQELARELAETRNLAGIKELADNLWNKDKNIQFDCVKVLYEIGHINPEMIAAYVGDFLKLLHSRHNRMVWGGALALSTIAALKADEIYEHRDEVKKAMTAGSVITVDNAVKILAIVAASSEARNQELFPYLIGFLSTCRPKSVPQYSESLLAAVNARNKQEFIRVLEKRIEDLIGSQAARVKKVLRQAKDR